MLLMKLTGNKPRVPVVKNDKVSSRYHLSIMNLLLLLLLPLMYFI